MQNGLASFWRLLLCFLTFLLVFGIPSTTRLDDQFASSNGSSFAQDRAATKSSTSMNVVYTLPSISCKKFPTPQLPDPAKLPPPSSGSVSQRPKNAELPKPGTLPPPG